MAVETDKKRKRIAAIVTVVFHVVAILLFLYFGLSEPNPPLEEQGASIEFGWDEAASGAAVADIEENQPIQEEVQQEQPIEEVVEESPVDEVVTDESSDVAVPDKKDEPKPKPKDPKPDPKPVEKPKPTITDKLSNALESLSNPSSGGGSDGDDEDGTGDKGDPKGTKGNGALGGGSGSWSLDGRSLRPGYGTKIETTTEEGTLVIEIWVDRQGNVTKAKPDLLHDLTNTTSQYLTNLAVKDVINNYKFNSSSEAGFSQHGRILYRFELE